MYCNGQVFYESDVTYLDAISLESYQNTDKRPRPISSWFSMEALNYFIILGRGLNFTKKVIQTYLGILIPNHS